MGIIEPEILSDQTASVENYARHDKTTKERQSPPKSARQRGKGGVGPPKSARERGVDATESAFFVGQFSVNDAPRSLQLFSFPRPGNSSIMAGSPPS